MGWEYERRGEGSSEGKEIKGSGGGSAGGEKELRYARLRFVAGARVKGGRASRGRVPTRASARTEGSKDHDQRFAVLGHPLCTRGKFRTFGEWLDGFVQSKTSLTSR